MSGASGVFLVVVALLGLVTMPVLFVATIVAVAKAARVLAGGRRPPAAAMPARPAVAAGRAPLRAPLPRPGRGAAGSRRARGESQRERLVVWRYRQLLQLDVDPVSALEASLAGVDAAYVRSLTRRGCPPALALSIATPDR